jgi:hypothetical protein
MYKKLKKNINIPRYEYGSAGNFLNNNSTFGDKSNKVLTHNLAAKKK